VGAAVGPPATTTKLLVFVLVFKLLAFVLVVWVLPLLPFIVLVLPTAALLEDTDIDVAGLEVATDTRLELDETLVTIVLNVVGLALRLRLSGVLLDRRAVAVGDAVVGVG